MAKKLMNFRTKGMNRDLSVSAFNPEFSFENINLRLSTNDDNTLLSWVNERGTKRLKVKDEETELPANLEGIPIGTAIIKDILVVFTHQYTKQQADVAMPIQYPDHIYLVKYQDKDAGIVEVEEKFHGNLGFNEEHPLETLVSYESEKIQKVYWIDGEHQARFINIVTDSERYYEEGKPVNTSFDFSGEIALNEDIKIVKSYSASNSAFPSGVIQYAFSYYNKNGAETALFRTTPLQYITFADRGASAEEKVNVAFKIYGKDLDTSYDYLRIYSIIRTSRDSVPIVKRVQDISLKEMPASENTPSVSETVSSPLLCDFSKVYIRYGNQDEVPVMEFLEDYGTPATYTSPFALSNGNHYIRYKGGNSENILKVPYPEESLKIVIKGDGQESVYTWPTLPEGAAENDYYFYFFPNGYEEAWGISSITRLESVDSCIVCARDTHSESDDENEDEIYELCDFIKEETVHYFKLLFIDTDNSGETVDPTHLLYLGGTTQVVPNTFEQKDNKLFLADLTVKNELNVVDSDTKTGLKKETITPVLCQRPFTKKNIGTEDNSIWINTLTCPEGIVTKKDGKSAYYEGASAFKVREWYRLGLQFQNKYGQWSEPCWIGDAKWDKAEEWDEQEQQSYYLYGPTYTAGESAFTGSNEVAAEFLPEFRYTIKEKYQLILYNKGFRRMRAVYAVPSAVDKTILCQGVINPTMYREADREEGFAYAQSSWLFRCPIDFAGSAQNGYNGFLDNHRNGGAVTPSGSLPNFYKWQYLHHDAGEDDDFGGFDDWPGLSRAETIDSSRYYIPEWDPWVGQWKDSENNKDRVWMPYYRSTEIMGCFSMRENYQVDLQFGTVHSPDIEFSDYFVSSDLTTATLQGVGSAHLDWTYGDINITTLSDSIKPNKGFKHQIVRTRGTSALISGNFYEDDIVLKYDEKFRGMFRDATRCFLWPVCMWQRDGSLNNDVPREGQSAILKTKIIGNYRYSYEGNYTASSTPLSNLGMGYYGFTEAAQLIKVNGKVYKGCIDKVLLPDAYSDYYPVGLITRDNGTSDEVPGIDGDISDVAAWEPGFTDLPVMKLHQNNIGNPDFADWVWLIQFKCTQDGSFVTTPTTWKKMPNYLDSGFPPNSQGYTRLMYRWNTLGGDYEDLGDEEAGLAYHRSTVPIKFKSTPHVAVQLGEDIFTYTNKFGYGSLGIVEICKPYNQDTMYGGTSDEALRSATWIPCGPITPINRDRDTEVEFKWGDTYYQRYECLKTYPYTPQDINQVVEIGSFMLETRTNIDGRYDRNRGYTNMLNVTPQTFNLINPVYSQLDNFFNYKILPEDYYTNTRFPNQITWTLTKENGADVDAWTNITLASTLDMDGNLGDISNIVRFNDQLIAFQEKGIAQILYNENTQMTTTEGVPIEIANSGAVQGKRYFTNSVGCSNKWSMAKTANGIYFMDSYNKGIYLFNGELTDLSNKFGFNSWAKTLIPSAAVKWNPWKFNNFVTYYDKLNQDVLFISGDTALAFSEKVGNFTSFYDYGDTPYFCNLEDTGLWITKNGELWQHQTGNYGRFFDTPKPYSMTLVGNPEPQTDKIFTNLEFRACTEGEGLNDLPFDYLETWNEYQHGIINLERKTGLGIGQHGLSDGTASLNRKFRMWRCDIPRDNAPLETDAAVGASRTAKHIMNRMRNPWLYLKLEKKASEDTWEDVGDGVWKEHSLPKAEIHDLVMTYYN